jgi:hypothetical protein
MPVRGFNPGHFNQRPCMGAPAADRGSVQMDLAPPFYLRAATYIETASLRAGGCRREPAYGAHRCLAEAGAGRCVVISPAAADVRAAVLADVRDER